MKRNILIYIGCILFLASTFASCKKYLDRKANTAFAVPTTLEDLQSILDYAITMNFTVTPSLQEGSADDFFILPTIYASRDEFTQKVYKRQPFDYNYGNDWSYCYNTVYNSNICLETLKSIPLTVDNKQAWDNVKGSALFFRAYYYLNLIWEYGKAYDKTTSSSDLGIVLRQGSDFNVPSMRASVEDSYQQIITDTKEAVNFLPDNSSHCTRPSKSAAYGLLARTYLSMRQYDSALKYSDLTLQLKNQLINYNGDPDINISLTIPIPFIKYNKETIFYSEMNTWITLHLGSQGLIDSAFYASYATNDLRKKAFFGAQSGYWKFKGNYTQNPSFLFTGIATDEMYLTRAECHARMGDKAAALSDLNTLLTKRFDGSFVQITAVNAQEALSKILEERRKELLRRGLRWIDIKRLNKEGRNIILTRKLPDGTIITLHPNANYYALPLPKDIIDQTGVLQNPQ